MYCLISTYSADSITVLDQDRSDIPIDFLSQILTSYLEKKGPNVNLQGNISLSKNLEDNNTGNAMLNFSNDNNKENFIISFSNPSSEPSVISGTCSKEEGKNQVYVQRNNNKTVIFEANAIDHV